jgi:hypothetical protein
MKLLRSLCIACLFCMLTAVSCNKDKNNDNLPPETQSGAGTFGCKIDGKVWVPKGSDGYSGQNIKAFYQYIYPSPIGYVFNIKATNYDKNPIESIVLSADSLKLTQGMILNLASGEKGVSGKGRFYTTGITYDTEFTTSEIVKGELLLNKFDEVNLIVSGVFWFDAVDNQGTIIHVTEGRFDKNYTR